MKIEEVKQHDLKDCGACSLACIIKYYNGYVPLEKIREDTRTSEFGTSAFHLIKAAESYGFEALGIRADNIHDKDIYLPAIAHLTLSNGLGHFVVIYKISNTSVWLMDPAKGKVKLKITEFTKIWNRVLIMFNPITENSIVHYDRETGLASILFKLLMQNKPLFITILIANFLFMLLSIASSFYFQIAVSQISSGSDNMFLKFIVLLFAIVLVFKVIITHLKNYYLNYLNKNLDVSLFSEFLSHIFHLPLNFIQNRSTGEITSRISELSDIKNLFAEIFTSVILNSVLIFGTLIALYFISRKLLFILCLVIITYILTGLIFNKAIYKKIKMNIEATTDFNSSLIENISMNTSIKNLHLIKPFLAKLENKLIIMLRNNFKFTKFLNFHEFLKNSISEIGLFITTTCGIYLISKGELELLNFITFNSLIIYLFDPIKAILSLLPKYNYLKASFSKIGEFLNIKTEDLDTGLKTMENPHLKIENLSYSYNLITNILKDVNMEINYGDKVFLKGPSGSGKSTLFKIITNTIKEYTGIVRVNNTSVTDYSLVTIRENILYVSQNESLFTGTIKENIMCYRDVPESVFESIVEICDIESIVKKRPHRYETVINASLNNLSGGEKQRIILARALLKKAQIIILDEALSEVNLSMEKSIVTKLLAYFKNETIIYVSHKDLSSSFTKTIKIGA